MKNLSISVKGKNYPLKFGFAALRQLSIIWRLPGPEAVGDKLSSAFEGFAENETAADQFTFDQMVVLNELIFSAILALVKPGDKLMITPDDIGDSILADPDVTLEIIEGYMAAFSTKKEDDLIKKKKGGPVKN
tara:strand:+ start:10585 stop:10983 length:399 start_codon:yes stop_codon:yes gene_type:complete